MGVMRAAIFLGVAISKGAAHQCGNGERIVCTAVQDLRAPGTPSSTHGMGAAGAPMCTPSGQKVYCLENHDYHQCSAGEEPCCLDGSDPSHHHDFNSPDDGFTCAPLQPPQPPSNPNQIVLDDMDSSLGISMKSAHEGSYQPCMEDAYNGQFHHDWATNKGSASFSITFDPPSSGCYKIEEYHPGSNPSCARYLPSNAILHVDYCKGLSTSFSIDQSQNPAQWNEVGKLMFFKGSSGKLTMRNFNGEKCSAESCYWVVDAFRMTRVGNSCTAMQKAASPAPSSTQEGTLFLSVRVTGANADAKVVLEQHQGSLESALSLNLGFSHVDVIDIVAAGRRLSETAGVSTFQVSFLAHGPTGNASPMGLKNQLITALGNSGADLEVVSARVELYAPPAPVDEPGSPFPFIVIAAGLLVVVCSVLSLVAYLRFCKQQKSSSKSSENVICNTRNEGKEEDLEGATTNDEMIVVKGKVETESTGSNSTEEPRSEDGDRSEASISKEQSDNDSSSAKDDPVDIVL